MWSNLMYMLPVTSILYNCVIDEEIKMEGNVADELERIFSKYLVNSRLKLAKTNIHANIYFTYPAGTNLWTILDTIMARFHLSAYIDERDSDMMILRLEEGVAWKR